MILKTKQFILTVILFFTFANIEARELTTTEKQKVSNVVNNYTKLLSKFSKTHRFGVQRDITSLFRDENTLIYSDVGTYYSEIELKGYLGKLKLNEQLKISYPTVSYSKVQSLTRPDELFGKVVITKQISGKTVTNIILVDIKDFKIVNIFDKLPVSNTNLTPMQMYQKALEYYNNENKSETLVWLEKTRKDDTGFAPALAFKGDMYYKGDGIEESIDGAVLYWLSAAIYYRLGTYRVNGIKINDHEAEKLFLKVSNANSSKFLYEDSYSNQLKARLFLGSIYKSNDVLKALEFWKGFINVKTPYYERLEEESKKIIKTGLKYSNEKTINWCKTNSNSGYRLAQYGMGYFYWNIEENKEKAVQYWWKAALNGDKDAFNALKDKKAQKKLKKLGYDFNKLY